MKKVKLTKQGVVSVGHYQRDVVYELDDAEAERLVKVKGFEYTTEEPVAPAQAVEG